MIFNAFGREDIQIFNDSSLLKDNLLRINPKNTVFLLMSSGDFNGLNISELGEKIISLRAQK